MKLRATEAELRKSTPRGKQLEDMAWKHAADAIEERLGMTPEQAFTEAAGPDIELVKFERYVTETGKRALDFFYKIDGRMRCVGGIDYDDEIVEAGICGRTVKMWSGK
jgi:hypothetical protein